MSEEIKLNVDTTEAVRKIDALEDKIEDAQDKLVKMTEAVENKARTSFMEVVGMAQSTWNVTMAVVRAAGGTIDVVFASLISSAVSSIAILVPLLTAESMTPAGIVQAGIGFTNIMLTQLAVLLAQSEKRIVGEQLSSIAMVLSSVNGLIGSMTFL